MYGAISATAPIVSSYIDPEFLVDVTDARGEVIDILSQAMLSNSKIVTIKSSR